MYNQVQYLWKMQNPSQDPKDLIAFIVESLLQSPVSKDLVRLVQVFQPCREKLF